MTQNVARAGRLDEPGSAVFYTLRDCSSTPGPNRRGRGKPLTNVLQAHHTGNADTAVTVDSLIYIIIFMGTWSSHESILELFLFYSRKPSFHLRSVRFYDNAASNKNNVANDNNYFSLETLWI